MCKVDKRSAKLLDLTRSRAVLGAREFFVDDNGILRPAFSGYDADAWHPRYAPVFVADRPPEPGRFGGFYANDPAEGTPQRLLVRRVQGVVRLYGRVVIGKDHGWGRIIVGEVAEIEALFINSRAGGDAFFIDGWLPGLLANYPDIPILEV